ncbi:MAG: cytochrome c [Fuerstia sp.]|nr:cytochrome c [Fuerstiella sp.]
MKPLNDFRLSTVSKLVISTACVAVAGWLAWSADAQEKEKKGPVEVTMRQKLEATSKVLEGLAIEDKELVHEGAKVLTELTKAEVWQVLKDSDYREHTQTFRSAVKRLDEAAQKSEFASAQLEWLDATKRCFDCHNHVRADRAAKAK